MKDLLYQILINENWTLLSQVLWIMGGFTLLVVVALFLAKAFSLYKMAQATDTPNAKLSFVPVANYRIFGSIAEKYQAKNGKKAAKFGVITFALKIAVLVLAVLLICLSVYAVLAIVANAETAIAEDKKMTMDMFSSLIPVVITYFVLVVASLAFNVVYFIALWRIFAVFSFKQAAIFLILSIIFGIGSIFMLFVKDNKPNYAPYN